MFRKLTLSFFLTVSAFAFSNFSFANLITVNGGSTAYSLNANDTLFIASGTYTGTVSGLSSANNPTIIVAGGATFQPTLLNPTNGVVCKMFIYGTFTYNQPLTTNTNFSINVYAGGVANFNNTVDTKGKDQVWTNNIGGTMNFAGIVTINGGTASDDNNVFYNYETINATANFIMKSGSKFYNYKDFNVTGNYTANGGILDNQGNFVVSGLIDMNSGASSIINHCRMEASGGISLSNGFFINYSYVWARNSDLTISSGASFTNIQIAGGATPPIVHGRNYTHTGGAMTGPALLYFYGTTLISGGTIGITTATTDTIKMNDITRASPLTVFDNQAAGTVRPNVIYNAWGIPDSLRNYLFGCSVEIFMEIPLAITWNYFYVNLSNNIPVLNWAADYEPGSVFELQRSYDGVHFQPIKNVAAESSRSEYFYDDRLVNTQSAIVYYRIKAIGLNGGAKYSEIRTVKFRSNQGILLYTAPNPFTSNFTIDLIATEKEMITIRLLNINGQQHLAKTVMVNKGSNTINITEAARLASGVYVVQVSNEHTLLSTSKIIKR
jgi:hypothetical protein